MLSGATGVAVPSTGPNGRVRAGLSSASERLPGRGTDPSPAACRVLVFARSRLVAAAVAGLLTAAGIEVVGSLADPLLLPERARRWCPDVLLTWCAAGEGFSDRLASLRAETPAAKTLAIVPAVDEATIRACLEARVAGAIADDCSPAELIEAIRLVRAGQVVFPGATLLALLGRARPPEADPAPASRIARLAPRELAVLQAFAHGLSTEAAARRLCISVHTVRAHLRNATAKLEVDSKLEAVIACLGAGAIGFPIAEGVRGE